jgi:Gluconate 2-dehydrogenase subunit 3
VTNTPGFSIFNSQVNCCHMNRRTAIRNVVIISAGTCLLPSCRQEGKTAINLKNISLTRSQEEMLAELAETIIPKTKSFIGAKDLKAHEFVLIMVDDCSGPAEQKKFTEGMKLFEESCKKKWDSSFIKCSLQQRNGLLQLMEKKQDIPEDAQKFYETVKRYTVQNFISSKEYMITVKNYKMVPGNKFKGCVPVT